MAIRMSGLNSGLDTEAIVKELMKAENQKVTNIKNKQTKLEWKTDKWKELNTKISTFYTGKLSNARFQSAYNVKKVNVADSTIASAEGVGNAVNGTHTLKVKQLAQAQSIVSGKMASGTKGSTKLSDLKLSGSSDALFKAGNSFTITVNEEGEDTKTVSYTVGNDDTINSFMSKLQEAGLNAAFDSTEGRFYISSKQSGTANSFTITKTATTVDSDGKSTTTTTALSDILSGTDNKSITTDAADAIFKLDNVEYKKSSNTNTINGLKVTVTGTTGDYDSDTGKTTTITVSNDIDSVYKNVKELLKEFNEVLTAVYDAYNADDASDYDILTDDQKEEMSDDEEKQWNDKIKGALLRRDDSAKKVLNHLQNDLTSAVVVVNGTKYSLSSFGISSVTYTEHGKLHLDGDSDDNLTSGNEDKLKKALEEDPDAASEALSQLFGKLYGSTKKGSLSGLSEIAMTSNDYKSSQKFYNDKQLTTEAADYKTELSEMQDKVADIEERYYDQFTRMEKALSTLNSQSSSISGMIGS